MNKLRVEDMRRHIVDLCTKYEINVTYCKGRAWAVQQFEEISIPPIRSSVSYATALHEIGHIKGRFQFSHDVVVRERWAWRWAKANALIWTFGMQRSAVRGLAWYQEQVAKGRKFADPNAEFQKQMANLGRIPP